MLPEFVQAEEQFRRGDAVTAALSLQRVQDVFDSSMGPDSPMSTAVHSMMLQYLTASLSFSTASIRLAGLGLSTVSRKHGESTDEDKLRQAYLSIVLGHSGLIVDDSEQELCDELHRAQMLVYRGVALAATKDNEKAAATFERAEKELGAVAESGSDERDQMLAASSRAAALHNIGCVHLLESRSEKESSHHSSRANDAMSTWNAALTTTTSTALLAGEFKGGEFKGGELKGGELEGAKLEGGEEGGGHALKRIEADILCSLGGLHTERGDPQEGIVCLSKAMEVLGDVEAHDVELARTLTLLGRAHHADSRAVSAEGYFRSALGYMSESRYGDGRGSGEAAREGMMQESSELSPMMRAQEVETLRMYASLLVDWESRESDYKKQMFVVNEKHEILMKAKLMPIPLGMSLPMPL